MIPRVLVALLAAAALLVAMPTAGQAAGPKPTVVLVHGAFADASGWTGEITRLEKKGYKVVAPANPLRGVASDVAYLRTFLSTARSCSSATPTSRGPGGAVQEARPIAAVRRSRGRLVAAPGAPLQRAHG